MGTWRCWPADSARIPVPVLQQAAAWARRAKGGETRQWSVAGADVVITAMLGVHVSVRTGIASKYIEWAIRPAGEVQR